MGNVETLCSKTPLKLNIDKPNFDDAFLDFGNKKVIHINQH